MSTHKILKGLAVVSAGAILTSLGAGVAAAQGTVTVIPGQNGDGRTVIVNRAGMTTTINSVDRAAGTVSVTMTNNTGVQLYCENPSQDASNRPGGSVSTAQVVHDSIQYYSRFQNTKAEEVAITMSVAGSSGTMRIPLWPLAQLIPEGSIGENASQAVKLRTAITEGNTQAKVKGLFGTTTAFALNNGATTTRTITLGPPSTSPRGEDKVGFFTICGAGANSAAVQGTAQLYAFSAYEDGWTPPAPVVEDESEDPSESTGSLSADLLSGSSSGGSGS